jgi:hypothetical protein
MSSAARTKVIALSALAAGIVAYLILSGSPPLQLPGKIGTLGLAYTVDGERANDILNRMHGMEVTPSRNLIGMYASASAGAVLYLSEYASAKDARFSFEKMARRIETGNPVFTGYRILRLGTTDVSVCFGQGQDHYFFSAGKILYWLAVDSLVSRSVAMDLVDKI